MNRGRRALDPLNPIDSPWVPNGCLVGYYKEILGKYPKEGVMTCIIGVKCVDGVVLGADRRLRRGEDVSEEDKITILEHPPVFLSSTGLVGLNKDEFQPRFMEEIAKRRIVNIRELKKSLEIAGREVLKEYEHLGDSAGIEAIVGGLSGVISGKATLYRLYPQGYADEVRDYATIGSAFHLTLPFLKILHKPNITVERAASIIGMLIILIQKLEIDINVGNKLDIAILKHDSTPYKEEEALEKAQHEAAKLEEVLRGTFLAPESLAHQPE